MAHNQNRGNGLEDENDLGPLGSKPQIQTPTKQSKRALGDEDAQNLDDNAPALKRGKLASKKATATKRSQLIAAPLATRPPLLDLRIRNGKLRKPHKARTALSTPSVEALDANESSEGDKETSETEEDLALDLEHDGTTLVEEGKRRLRKYIACKDCFPTYETASSCLTGAVEKFFPIDHDSVATTPEMIDRIFEERSRFLTLLKDICVVAAAKHYSNAIDPQYVPGGNQMEGPLLIQQQIEELIGKKSLFHLGKPDALNKSSNVMHECIKDVCIEFYYRTGANALARESDEFRDSVPEHAVALVVACIYNALDEYRDGTHSTREFSPDLYRPAYEAVIEMIEKIKTNAYHKAKWDESRKVWAAAGRVAIESQDEIERRRLVFAVYLD